MKAEHRHELKTNELAEWLNNLPQWLRKNRNTIIYIAVAAVAIGAYSFWFYHSKNTAAAKEHIEFTKIIRQLPQNKRQILQGHSQGVDISYMLIQTADNLQSTASNCKNSLVAASALIKRAEALRMELHYRVGTVSREDATAQINRAKAAYSEAVKKAESNPSLAAIATFGLGLCEEEIGNLDEARQIYRSLATNGDLEYTTASVQAKQRLDSMAQQQHKVVFKAPAKPAAPAPLRPQIELYRPDSDAK